MATYTKVYNNPYPDGWKDGKDGNTPVTAEILNNQTETLESIEQYLADNPIEQGGSGTGGTTDYEALENKPTINGVELVGDLSAEDLGLTGGGGTGTTNYEDLTNKPSINGTELSGDITLDIPEKTSDLTNDSGFLTEIPEQSYNDLADKPQINGIDLQGNLTVEELGLLDITESTDTTLENSKDGVLKIKEIYGNTEQDGEPTPDVPIEIKSVVLSEMKTCGKNLAKINETDWTVSKNYITNKTGNGGRNLTYPLNLKANTTYYIRLLLLSKPTTDTTFTSYIGNVASAYSFSSINTYDLNKVYTATFTPKQDETLFYRMWGNANSDIFNFQFWISTDKADKTYEPYTESVATWSEPITLNGLNGVSDYIDVKRGVLVQKIIKKSNLTFTLASGYTVGNSELFAYGAGDGANKGTIVSNVLPFKHHEILANDTNGAYQLYNNIYARIQGVSDVDEFNSLIANNEFVYELSEPIETPLPEADVEALKSLKTYDGVTHIFTDSEVSPSWLVEYNTTRVGTELDEIDAELAKINKRITDIGTTAQMNYSTEEQVVGTWLGKTLYQKSYHMLCEPETTYLLDEEIKQSTHISTSIQGAWVFGDYTLSDVFQSSINSPVGNQNTTINPPSIRIDAEGLKIKPNHSTYGYEVNFTIQYTKTTDTV